MAIANAASGAWGPDWLRNDRFLVAPGAILSAAHGSAAVTAPPRVPVGESAAPGPARRRPPDGAAARRAPDAELAR